MQIIRPPISVLDNIPSGRIGNSPIHGMGLFAVKALRKNELLGVLDGQEVSWDYYHRLRESLTLSDETKNLFFFEWNAINGQENVSLLLVRCLQTKYSYINHSRNPNLFLRTDVHHIKIITLRDIAKDEELLLDYRNEPLPQQYIMGHGATYL